jgi:hypothetical protein
MELYEEIGKNTGISPRDCVMHTFDFVSRVIIGQEGGDALIHYGNIALAEAGVECPECKKENSKSLHHH